jgi:hypothetical protein
MCGLKGLKLGNVEVEEQRPKRARSRKCKPWCKFHMLKNPWSEHVTPSENYNPVWTGIPQSKPSSWPYLRPTTADGKDITRSPSSLSSTPGDSEANYYIYYDKPLLHGKCEGKGRHDAEKRRKMSKSNPRQVSYHPPYIQLFRRTKWVEDLTRLGAHGCCYSTSIQKM